MKKIIAVIILIASIVSVGQSVEANQRSALVKYKVKPGETLWNIAKEFNIDIPTILSVNPKLKNANFIKAGQVLNILTIKGTIHRIHPGETLWDVSRAYQVSVDRIIKVNKIKKANLIRPGRELIIPGAKPLKYVIASWQTNFIWPISSKRITSPFGRRRSGMHHGLDIGIPQGSLVKAAKSGRITRSEYSSSYGKVVYIDHQDGTSSRYAHNSRLLVRRGQYVYQGQPIAYSGNTGRSTGPHLHFEIRVKGKAIDPLRYLD